MVMIFYTDLSAYPKLIPSTHLAVLHDIQLSEPCLIKRVTGCVNNVTEAILLCQNEHRVQEGFHRLDRLDESGAGSVD